MQRLEFDEPLSKRRRIEKLVRGVKEEEGVVGGTVPRRVEEADVSEAEALTDRLKMFLPQLQAANTFLDQTKNIEDVDEDEEYIEMNLGLGVLEEKRDSDDDEEEEEEDDDDLDTDEEGNVFDKLLRRTRDPGRRELVESVDPGGKGDVQLMGSSDDTEESSDEESHEDEQEEESHKGVTMEDETFKKRGEDVKSRDNG